MSWRLPAGRTLVLALPFAWLGLFFLFPFLIVARIALSEAALGIPPYAPLLRRDEQGTLAIVLNLGAFALLVEDSFYLDAYLRSLRVASLSALLCLLAGYPMAYAIARAPERRRNLLLLLVVLPFWTSFLLRVMAWIGLLADNGVVNNILLGLGLVTEPLRLLYTETALYLGIVYCYLPFMVLPLYANLVKLDPALLEAASDLGARPWRAFLAVTLPLSLPGILAGFMLVFIPAVGEFVIPELLGGPDAQLIGRVLWTEFFQNRDWPMASALAVVLLLLLVLPIAWFQHLQGRAGGGR
ncbi:ABC transporter permease subunit [Elioraea sp. Yellowstone]|jgi:putrescine transport system permease protein|uniref:ABC transporter permease subunit n=1 Tax=Elioraea sp. Yellowstone TaxID=2592070 RepID=UPI0011530128|nr:ABC transporter permease subunit [Elioraea sp. Yellowstone]TQF82833.1 ABC transporter permease subunit [Elioraea sp. Yellowstone]